MVLSPARSPTTYRKTGIVLPPINLRSESSVPKPLVPSVLSDRGPVYSPTPTLRGFGRSYSLKNRPKKAVTLPRIERNRKIPRITVQRPVTHGGSPRHSPQNNKNVQTMSEGKSSADFLSEELEELKTGDIRDGKGISFWLLKFTRRSRRCESPAQEKEKRVAGGVGDKPKETSPPTINATAPSGISTALSTRMKTLRRQPSWGLIRQRLISSKVTEAFSKLKFSVMGQQYQALRLLGEGGYSRVYEVFNDKNLLFALKVVNLRIVDPDEKEAYFSEIKFLELFSNSSRVVRIHGHELVEENDFGAQRNIGSDDEDDEEEDTGQALMVLMERGETDLDLAIKGFKDQGRLTVAKIKYFWEEMLEAVKVVHKKNVAHCDIKPGNFVLVNGQLKLIDLGFAMSVPDGYEGFAYRDKIAGTKGYLSPEMLSCYSVEEGELKVKEDPRVQVRLQSDIWALGVILYHLSFDGLFPFHGIAGGRVAKIQATIDPHRPVDLPQHEDEDLLDTLALCLKKNASERPTAEDLLNHPFLTRS